MENVRLSLFVNFRFVWLIIMELVFTCKYLLSFTSNAPLIFYFELIFLICSFFFLLQLLYCSYISRIKHVYIVFHMSLLLTVLLKYSMISSNNLTSLKNNVKRWQCSKKRIKLIEYFKIKLNHNWFIFYKKHTQLLKTKIHWSMILMGQFSCLIEHLTHAVF